jgi:predicted RNase H-like HicB family nuclease
MVLCDLKIELEELNDGGDYRYMATSPDLPGLLVVGDTAEEVLALAPQVASAWIASRQQETLYLKPCTRSLFSHFPPAWR